MELVFEGVLLFLCEIIFVFLVVFFEIKFVDWFKFFSCLDLSSVFVCILLVIRDIKFGDVIEIVEGLFFFLYFGEGFLWVIWLGCEDVRGIWVLVFWVLDFWVSCFVKLFNCVCFWVRNWIWVVFSFVCWICYCVWNFLYFILWVSLL